MKKVQAIVLACSLCMRPLGVHSEDTRYMYESIIAHITRQSRGTFEQRTVHDFYFGSSMLQVKTDYTEGEILRIKRKNALNKLLGRCLVNPTTFTMTP